MWSKQERMAAVMNGEPADRPPVTAYRHFPGYEEDAKLIAETVEPLTPDDHPDPEEKEPEEQPLFYESPFEILRQNVYFDPEK